MIASAKRSDYGNAHGFHGDQFEIDEGTGRDQSNLNIVCRRLQFPNNRVPDTLDAARNILVHKTVDVAGFGDLPL